MGKSQRNKGARGEREVASILAEALNLPARRGVAQCRAGSDAADVEGTPWWVEVKIGARPNIVAAMRQAVTSADARPPVVWTRRDREDWLVTMRASDWLLMAKKETE